MYHKACALGWILSPALSHSPLAKDFWQIQKTIKKGFFKKYLWLQERLIVRCCWADGGLCRQERHAWVEWNNVGNCLEIVMIFPLFSYNLAPMSDHCIEHQGLTTGHGAMVVTKKMPDLGLNSERDPTFHLRIYVYIWLIATKLCIFKVWHPECDILSHVHKFLFGAQICK